ncbi:MAG: protein ImuB [Candidatus Azotimanducaceae bacterium]|jgi:protein ImuB
MNTSNLWLGLHFPNLPIEVYSRGQHDQPIVVVRRTRVEHINECAAKLGVKSGSSMNTAYTISEQIVSFERDEGKELAVLQHLGQWAYQFSPNIVIKPPHSLLIDIAGSLKLFHGLDNLKKQMTSGLDKLGFSVQIGVNRTPLAALCFAETSFIETGFIETGFIETGFAETGFAETGLVETSASRTGSSATEIAEQVRESLAKVPVSHLRVDEKIIGSLHQMGISQCEQLFALPVDGLNRRYGVFFTDYLQRLTGAKSDPQSCLTEKPQFASDITFLSDVTNTESLIFPIKRLLGEFSDFLIKRQLLVNQFTFRLSHRNHPPISFTVFLAGPDNDAQMFLMLSQLQLEKVQNMPEVDNLALTARQFLATEAHSGDLFHGTKFQQKDGRIHSKADETSAVRLINMMTARLGPQACFGLSEANDHRPEWAWKPVRLAAKDYWQGASPLPNARPLYLLPKPKPLSSDAGEPCLSGKLGLLQGPERIDFGWWDTTNDNNRAVARDYYIARHKSGSLYWVYQHLDNPEWFLHGIFS